MNKEQAVKYFTIHKHLFGFTEYDVVVGKDTTNEEIMAKTILDYCMRLLTLRLDKKFYKTTDRQQKEILIHELIHARFGIMQERISDMTKQVRDVEEEDCVMDITRGFMELKDDW